MEISVNKLISHSVKGADIYHHDGNTWLIFTDKKEWVIMIRQDGTLFYNYCFFKHLFEYASLDMFGSQYYIIAWVENIINNEVKDAHSLVGTMKFRIENIMRNGVRDVFYVFSAEDIGIKGVIENGDRF